MERAASIATNTTQIGIKVVPRNKTVFLKNDFLVYFSCLSQCFGCLTNNDKFVISSINLNLYFL